MFRTWDVERINVSVVNLTTQDNAFMIILRNHSYLCALLPVARRPSAPHPLTWIGYSDRLAVGPDCVIALW